MIRQAISCDICGAEKRQTNHWFVAYEQSGELRVSGWTSLRRTRPGSTHLCGQTGLPKLVDDFMAGSIAVCPAIADAEPMPAPTAAADTSLTSNAAHAGVGSSIGLLTPAPPQPVRRPSEPPTFEAVDLAVPLDEPSRYAARAWRSDAWERERERGQKPEVMVRRGL